MTGVRVAVLAAAILVVWPAAARAAGEADKLVAEGKAAYEKADYGSALLKFEQAVKQGAAGGELFYQMGFCYRTVRDDQESARSHMARALPLLEQQLKEPGKRSLDTYYYMAAIRLNEIPDADALAALSREAVAALESGALPKPKSGEDLFQAGRLYGFAGQRDKAVEHYEKAITALEKEGTAKQGILRHCLQASADAAAEKQQWDKAASLYQGLLKAEPSDAVRLPLALTLFKAGREMDAIPVWREIADPRYEGDKIYLERVARRYVELGRPAAVSPPADGQALRTAILDAAKVYAVERSKDEEAAKAAYEKWQQEAITDRQNRRKSKAQTPQPSLEELEKIPVEQLTPEQRLRLQGITDIMLDPPPPPPSPSRVEAEKVFFGLLAEMVRRGQLLQDFALTNGLAPLIFK
ncbi:MAG: hypothetical protein ACREAA_15235 [Candidatus Polarisedimenticolia bacterium]